MDTLVFQRMRRINQLALADMVYPGCVHNRFVHSIGTLAVADAIWVSLESRREIPEASADDRQIVRLAALLHDIGHGPFSHVTEYLLDRYSEPEAVSRKGSSEKQQIHELIASDIISHDPSLTAILDDKRREDVVSLLVPQGGRDFRRAIISGGLDADKLDYLSRDTYFAGVEYGRVDRAKILDSCRIVRDGSDSYLGIHEDGRFAVEQMILAKWHMNQQVYAHRVRTITDAMIVRGL